MIVRVSDLEDLISINEPALERMVLDIYDHCSRINSILNQINDLILDSKTYFDCAANSYMLEQYSEMKLSIDNFKSNISTYAADLTKVKNKFKSKDSDLTQIIRTQVTKIQSDIK